MIIQKNDLERKWHYLLLKNWIVLICLKLNPLHLRICQVWLKLAPWLWRRRFLNFNNVILPFRNFLPLEKDAFPLNKVKPPSPKDAVCQVWLKLARWFWRRSRKSESITGRRTNRRTDNRTYWRSVPHLSFQLRWG